MLSEGVSAIGAMSVLRGQIEDRLLRTEDYRALKALERAILDVQGQAPVRFEGLSSSMTGSLHAASSQLQASGIESPAAALHQRLSEKFTSSAA